MRFHNEQRIALHVDQSPLGVIEWDLDFKVKRWNPAAERIFGYSASEALNQNAGFIVPKKYLKHVDQVWEQLLKQKGGSRSTNENIRKDGKTIICDWYNTPLINDEGKVIAVSSLIKDISENVRAEHIQKILFNISNAALSAEEIRIGKHSGYHQFLCGAVR